MDVTPHELRTIELREAWRGYRQDDVDELLDRVATTIEGLQGQVQRLTDRLERAEEEVGLGKEADEMLRRTLLLAQRTADAAVSEAQERARRLTSEAEAKATTLVTGAEEEARRLSLHERRRLEGEVRDLARKRDTLTADVDTLEKFASDHRRRVREFLEAELGVLEERPVPEMPDPPILTEVEIPDETEEEFEPPPPPPPPEPEPDHDDAAEIIALDIIEPVAAAEAEPDTEGMSLDAIQAELEAPRSPADLLPTPPPAPEPAVDAIVDFDDLDDDQYLAELRRAVEDDTPLGPRDEDLAELAELADLPPDRAADLAADAAAESDATPWTAEPDEWTAADRAILFDQDAEAGSPSRHLG